jgi:two-component system response regulator HydG
VLEDKRITPVGSTQPVDVDVRLIAATNADLESEVESKRFRADLFYRLNVIPIQIPPLRERKEDIPLLLDYFVARFCEKLHVPVKTVTDEARQMLVGYNWPGNVRELENTIERAILINRTGSLEMSDFPERLTKSEPPTLVGESSPVTPTLESIEKAYIHFVMSQTDGKKTEAARILGIDTSTLYRKIERYQLKDLPPTRGRRQSKKDRGD